MARGQEIASFYATIGADTSGLQKGLEGARNSLGGLANMAGAAVNAVKVAVMGAGVAFAGMATAVAVTGVQFDDMKERAEIAFSTMLGSGEKAKTFLDDLQKFAASTPFEFQDLISASQRLMAMGISADKVLPTMTAVGDAVAALGGDKGTVDRVVTALGQINAKGKASAEEMMQLTEAGIPAWQMLADKIGKSVPEAMAEVTKGAINAQTTIDAVTEGMEKKFGGMMEKQSHTWSGLLSNVKDFFAQASGKVMKPFFDFAEKKLAQLVDFMGGDAFQVAVNKLTMVFEMLTSDNQSWGQKLVAIWDMIYQTGLTIWNSLAKSLSSLIPGWLNQLAEWAVAIWDWIVKATPTALAKLGEWAKALWNWIVTNLPTWVSNLGKWAVALWNWIVEVTPIAVAKLVEWGSALVSWVSTNLPSWVNTLSAWATAAWKWLSDVIPIVATKIGDWGTALLNWLQTNAPLWQSKLAEWGTAAWKWLANILPTVVAKMGEWGMNVIGWVTENLPTFVSTMLGWGTAIVKWIGDAAPKAINALASFVQGLRGEGDGAGANGIGQMVANWAKKLWGWITDDALPNVPGAFMEFLGAIWTAGGNILTALGGLAVQLGTTLWSWIVVATPIAANAIATWGSSLWSWVNANAGTWANAIAGWATVAWQWIANVTPIVLGKLAEWGSTLWNWISTNAPGWLQVLGTWATAAWQWIVNATPVVLAKLAEWGRVIWEWVTTNAPTWGAKLAEWGALAWDWLTGDNGVVWMATDKLGEWATAIYNWVTDPVNVTYWSDKLIDWATYAWDWLVGENGVVWMAGDKLTEWATAIYDWLTDPANIKSWSDGLSDWSTTAWEWLTGPDGAVAKTKAKMEEWGALFFAPDGPGGKTLDWMQRTFPGAVTAFQGSLTVLNTAWSHFNTEFGGNLQTTQINWGLFWKFFVMALDGGVATVLLRTATLVANVALSFAALHAAINGDWDAMWADIMEISENESRVQDAQLRSNIGTWGGIMTLAGMGATEGFAKGIDSGSDKGVHAMHGFSDTAANAFQDSLDMHSPSRVFEGFGTNVVEGFENGFTSRWDQFRNHISPTVNGWVSWFRGVFGINSPSTVFAEIGGNIVEGLANGLAANQHLVIDAMGNVASEMKKASEWDTLGSAIGMDKAKDFVKKLNVLGANASAGLVNRNVAKGNIAYDWANNAMNATLNDPIATLKNYADNLAQQLNEMGVTGGTSKDLYSLSDSLGHLTSTGNYSNPYTGTLTPTPKPTTPAAGGDAAMVVALLKALIELAKKEVAIDEKGFANVVNALSNTGGLNHAVTTKTGLR